MKLSPKGRLYTLNEVMTWSDPEWLIDGLVHRGSCVFLSGPPKTGKSLFALRVTASVSSGTPLFGHATRKGRVVYIAAERSGLMKPRVQALAEQGIAIEPANVSVYPQPVPFLDEKAVQDFAAIVGEADLIIVDTLRRCFAGGQENDNNDMTSWATGVEMFCDLTGSAAIVIHHNRREQRDSRGRVMASDYAGGGSLLGSFDGQLSLKSDSRGMISIKVESANEGNCFAASARTISHQVGSHVTWVMIEHEEPKDGLDQVKLADLVRDVLIANPRTSLAELLVHCKAHPTIQAHYPKLTKGTLSRITTELVDEGSVTKEPDFKHSQRFLLTWELETKPTVAKTVAI